VETYKSMWKSRFALESIYSNPRDSSFNKVIVQIKMLADSSFNLKKKIYIYIKLRHLTQFK